MDMKNKTDIEKYLEKMADAYQTPEGYFEHLHKTFDWQAKSENNRKIFKINTQWMVAAMFLLLISLGWFAKQQFVPKNSLSNDTIKRTNFPVVNQENFDDLSDDEIMDYLENDTDMDEILDYL